MKELRIGAMLSYISIFLTFVIGLVYTPILIRFLGQNDYGLYSLIIAFASYLSLMDLGVGNAIVRYISQNRSSGNLQHESVLIGQFLRFFLFISFLVVIIGGAVARYTPNIFSNGIEENDVLTIQIMILVLTFNFAVSFPLNVFSSVLQAYEKFIFLRLINILRTLLVPLLTVIALYFGGKLISMTIVLTLVNLTILMWGAIYCKRKLKIKISFAPLNSNIKKDIITYSSFIFLTALADKLYWQTDQILLGILDSPETVAVYAVSIQFVMIFMSLSTAISSLFLPSFSMLVTKENHLSQLNHLFIKVSRVQFYILFLALSGFVLFGKEFIQVWAGPEYVHAYIIVIILMIPFFFDLIQNTGLVILQAKGWYQFRTYSLIICAVLNLLISIPVIQAYGSTGTAVITAIFVGVGNVALLNFYYQLKVKLNIVEYWRVISLTALPLLILTIGFYYLKISIDLEAPALFVIILIYIFLYLITLYFFVITREEKNYLRSFLRRC